MLSQPLGPHVLPATPIPPYAVARPIGQVVGARARAARGARCVMVGRTVDLPWGGVRARSVTIHCLLLGRRGEWLRLNTNIYCNHVFAVARYAAPRRPVFTMRRMALVYPNVRTSCTLQF